MNAYDLTNEELLEVVKDRMTKDKTFRIAIKSTMKESKSAEKEYRENKEKSLSLLFSNSFEGMEPVKFIREIKTICDGDTPLYHKYLDLYTKEKRHADKLAGRPCSV